LKKIFIIGTVFLVSALAMIIGTGVTNVASTKPGRTLPASLDNYYPPKAQGPAYLMAMHKLNMPLAGLVCDLFENDMGNVFMNLDEFKAEYRGVAGLVPEWTDEYPEAPLTELEAALTNYEAREARYKLALAQVEQREAVLASSKIRLGYTRLTASGAGLIGERFVDARVIENRLPIGIPPFIRGAEILGQGNTVDVVPGTDLRTVLPLERLERAPHGAAEILRAGFSLEDSQSIGQGRVLLGSILKGLLDQVEHASPGGQGLF